MKAYFFLFSLLLSGTFTHLFSQSMAINSAFHMLSYHSKAKSDSFLITVEKSIKPLKRESRSDYLMSSSLEPNPFSSQNSLSTRSELGKVQLGLGYGIPYGGGLGAKIEYHPLSIFSLEAGLAHTIFSKIGYNAGLKVYPLGPKEMKKANGILHHYASLHFGSNGILIREFKINHSNNQTYTGFTAGIGTKTMWDRHGFNVGLLFVLTSGLFKDPEYINMISPNQGMNPLGGINDRLKLALGYEYSF